MLRTRWGRAPSVRSSSGEVEKNTSNGPSCRSTARSSNVRSTRPVIAVR